MENKMVLVRYERDLTCSESAILSREDLSMERMEEVLYEKYEKDSISYEIREGSVFAKCYCILSYQNYSELTEQYANVHCSLKEEPKFDVNFKFTFNEEDETVDISVMYKEEEWLAANAPDSIKIEDLLESLDPCLKFDMDEVVSSYYQ